MLSPSIPFDERSHLYLEGIYRDPSRQVVVMKSGQAGASEWAISYALWCCDKRAMNVLYLLPTIDDVSDFSQMRFEPAIEASPYLSAVLSSSNGGDPMSRRKKTDKVRLKRIGNNYLILRGTQVGGNIGYSEGRRASQLKSVPADAVVYDEFDEMAPTAEALAEKRLGHSLVKEERWLSTPTFFNVGIHARYLESSMAQWFVPCPHCGHRQVATINHIIYEWDELRRPRRWHGREEGRAFPACERCGGEIDRLARGEWVHAYPERDMRGYHITKLFSAQNEPLAIVQALFDLSAERRQEVWNQDLGEPFRPEGSGMSDEVLKRCARSYAAGPVVNERTVMGVDVGRVLHVVIRSATPLPPNGLRPLRFVGEVMRWDELPTLMRQYNVRTCVIDAMPEHQLARSFQAAQPSGKVWLAYYTTSSATRKEDPVQWDVNQGALVIDRTRLLDETFGRFQEQVNVLNLAQAATPDYAAHLKALVRVTKKDPRTGNLASAYVNTGADHFAHAENYCTAASMKPATPGAVIAFGKAKGW